MFPGSGIGVILYYVFYFCHRLQKYGFFDYSDYYKITTDYYMITPITIEIDNPFNFKILNLRKIKGYG